MRFAGFVVMTALVVSGCSTLGDLMPFGSETGVTPETATSTTPGLAVDRKPGFPPYAMMKGTVLIAPHGGKRTDFFFWMNEKKNPGTIRYLEEENKYAGEVLANTADLQKTLRTEITAFSDAVQGTPPFKMDGYYYYERYAPGADYPIIARRKGSMSAPEQIVLDGEAEGKKHTQFKVNHYGASPEGDVFVYAADYAGDRWHTILFRDMNTGAMLPDKIEYVAPDFAFASDNKTFFYLKLQAGTARAHKLMRHVMGTDTKTDKLVFEEKDQQFELALTRSKGGRVLLLTSEQTNTSEVRFVDAAKPTGAWAAIKPRATGVRYFADEVGGVFYIRTNLDAPDYRIMTAQASAPGTWSELIEQTPGVFIDHHEVMGGYIALNEYARGSSRIRVRNIKTGEEKHVPADDPLGYVSSSDEYTFAAVHNTDPSSPTLRYGYTSPYQPPVIYDYNFATGAKSEVQRTQAAGHDPSAFAMERLTVNASDGRQIPVTLAYHHARFQRGSSPVLVYAYGAYGSSNDPIFRSRWPALMTRGFAIAFAHVRGGRELGQAWYEEGRLRNKKNTFTDFIAVAENMKTVGDPKRIFAMGRSAGGLTVGAAVNMRPDLFKGVVANVPFVDVVTTMLDDSIPLTTFEYEEWGNPGDSGDYAYMLSYSPYDQVEKKAYPAMLVTAGYNDSQVAYFEPAKWVAKLRRNKTDGAPLIFRTNMGAGHSGETGRFGPVEEAALIDAFLLDQAGLNPAKTASADD